MTLPVIDPPHDAAEITLMRALSTVAASALESSLDAVIGADEDGRVIAFNRAAEQVFGYSAAEVRGREVAELFVPPHLRQQHRDALHRYITTSETTILGRRVETVAMRRDGTEFPVELTVVRVDARGPTRFTAFVRDLSERVAAEAERRRLEERIRQMEKMQAVGQLAGGIAHDFNNLLTAISGYAELALVHAVDAGNGAYIEQVIAAANRATALTQQLLAFSRNQVLQPTVLDLNDVLANTEKLLRPLIGEHVELVTAFDRELCHVKADRSQVEQVVINLIVNARDALPQGGRLELTTRNVLVDDALSAQLCGNPPPGPYVCLTVADDGCGMDAETAARIFEPFFTTKERGKGTGLGLSTVHGIVMHTGGAISVVTEPGAGTAFDVYLPCADGEEADDVSAGEEPAASGDLVHLEVIAAPIRIEGKIVGVFGIAIPLSDTRTPPIERLSPRQVDVLRLLVQGKSTRQIAAELHLAPETVRKHVRRLLRALDARTRLEAALIALRHGLVSLDVD